jgi:hypothetical protein
MSWNPELSLQIQYYIKKLKIKCLQVKDLQASVKVLLPGKPDKNYLATFTLTALTPFLP